MGKKNLDHRDASPYKKGQDTETLRISKSPLTDNGGSHPQSFRLDASRSRKSRQADRRGILGPPLHVNTADCFGSPRIGHSVVTCSETPMTVCVLRLSFLWRPRLRSAVKWTSGITPSLRSIAPQGVLFRLPF